MTHVLFLWPDMEYEILHPPNCVVAECDLLAAERKYGIEAFTVYHGIALNELAFVTPGYYLAEHWLAITANGMNERIELIRFDSKDKNYV